MKVRKQLRNSYLRKNEIFNQVSYSFRIRLLNPEPLDTTPFKVLQINQTPECHETISILQNLKKSIFTQQLWTHSPSIALSTMLLGMLCF